MKRLSEAPCKPSQSDDSAVLYYDGACALCSREMATLKKHANNKLCLKDIHTLSESEQSNLPPKKDLLMMLHAQTSDGRWVIGADANVFAWQYTRFGKLFSFLRWPVVRSIVDFVYRKWAVRRYEANLAKGLYKDSV